MHLSKNWEGFCGLTLEIEAQVWPFTAFPFCVWEVVEGEIGFGKSCFCSKDDSRGVCGQVGRSPTCNRERYDSPHLRGSGIGVCAKNAKDAVLRDPFLVVGSTRSNVRRTKMSMNLRSTSKYRSRTKM
jgi:hypothetical protein